MLDSVLVWFRRDLRSNDHAALAEATRRARQVHCVFVFDREILDALPRTLDRRVEFIRESLIELDEAFRSVGGRLIVRNGVAREEIPRLAASLGVDAVFTNRDYEPAAKRRDTSVADALRTRGIGFESFKDQAVFEYPEILTTDGRPFTVFTPFKRAWLKRLSDDDLPHFPVEFGRLAADASPAPIPTLAQLGFLPTNLRQVGIAPGMSGAQSLLKDFATRIGYYHVQRDFPAIEGTSRLSAHLRFGTISIRELVAIARNAPANGDSEGASRWLDELIWRDFYFMILDQFPHVVDHSFKPAFDRIRWESGDRADALFGAWCEGRTGYPLVDAAMRQLNTTGFMHNRLRMVTASFLIKDLGIDWRRGEAYFAERLNDFDLSANNGGWQWAASSGCDAQPYFRIFNPVLQSERFDPHGRFIRSYIPELASFPEKHIHAPWRMPAHEQAACGTIIGRELPPPLVDHDEARRKTQERYSIVRTPGDA